jgi:hypothetical protein
MKNKVQFLEFLSNVLDKVQGEWEPDAQKIVLEPVSDEGKVTTLLKELHIGFDYIVQSDISTKVIVRQRDYGLTFFFDSKGKFLRFELFEL